MNALSTPLATVSQLRGIVRFTTGNTECLFDAGDVGAGLVPKGSVGTIQTCRQTAGSDIFCLMILIRGSISACVRGESDGDQITFEGIEAVQN